MDQESSELIGYTFDYIRRVGTGHYIGDTKAALANCEYDVFKYTTLLNVTKYEKHRSPCFSSIASEVASES